MIVTPCFRDTIVAPNFFNSCSKRWECPKFCL